MTSLIERVLRWVSGIRTKVVLLSGLLLLLPFIGYNYVWELENVLRQGQEQTVMGSARAFSMALNQQPRLFERQRFTKPRLDDGKDLYAFDLNSHIDLDGSPLDWERYREHFKSYTSKHVIFSKNTYKPDNIKFDLVMGNSDLSINGHFHIPS